MTTYFAIQKGEFDLDTHQFWRGEADWGRPARTAKRFKSRADAIRQARSLRRDTEAVAVGVIKVRTYPDGRSCLMDA